MSEATTEVVDTEAVTDEPETTTTTEPDLGDAGKKALAAERAAKRAAEKRAAELEARVKEFEDSTKSEAEKAAARAEAAEKRAAEAEAKALRLEIANELNVPESLRKFLTATDDEGLRAQAEELTSALSAATAPQRNTPKPDPTQGAKPAGASAPLTKEDLQRLYAEGRHEDIVKARKEGRLDEFLGFS